MFNGLEMQKKLFAIESSLLGDGKLSFAWHPKGLYLAAAGSKVSGDTVLWALAALMKQRLMRL